MIESSIMQLVHYPNACGSRGSLTSPVSSQQLRPGLPRAGKHLTQLLTLSPADSPIQGSRTDNRNLRREAHIPNTNNAALQGGVLMVQIFTHSTFMFRKP